MKAIDGSVIDFERLDSVIGKIEAYKKTKENNVFDAFYTADLAVFETGIELMRKVMHDELHTVCKVKMGDCHPDMKHSTAYLLRHLDNVECIYDSFSDVYIIKCTNTDVVNVLKSMEDYGLIHLEIDENPYAEK